MFSTGTGSSKAGLIMIRPGPAIRAALESGLIGEVLTEILKDRIPVNSYNVKEIPEQKQFVIRRWYPHGSQQ